MRAGIFTLFSPRIRVVANSQDTFRLWIRIRKLEATTTRRRRGSPVCKKELSSNRINDPLASIYRTRRGGRHGGEHAAGTCKDELVELSSREDEAAAVSPRRPSAARYPRARKILFAFLRCWEVYAVAGSLTARALLLRTASVNPVFGYILLLGCGTSVQCGCQKKKVSYNLLLRGRNPKT